MNTVQENEAISGSEIPEVNLIPNLTEIRDLISRTCEYFFKNGSPLPNSPFKGFLLEGVPGTGKTEIVKQVSRKLDRRLGNIYWLFVDGASIATPKWGDAEKAIRQVFRSAEILGRERRDPKVIIHFDDVECLMMARGVDLAKEWHYSINSILFHEIDRLNPSSQILCATTNRSDLVDDALRDRLYSIIVPPPPKEELAFVIKEILDSTGVTVNRDKIEKKIHDKINEIKAPTIRDARKITVIECIKERVWAV